MIREMEPSHDPSSTSSIMMLTGQRYSNQLSRTPGTQTFLGQTTIVNQDLPRATNLHAFAQHRQMDQTLSMPGYGTGQGHSFQTQLPQDTTFEIGEKRSNSVMKLSSFEPHQSMTVDTKSKVAADLQPLRKPGFRGSQNNAILYRSLSKQKLYKMHKEIHDK